MSGLKWRGTGTSPYIESEKPATYKLPRAFSVLFTYIEFCEFSKLTGFISFFLVFGAVTNRTYRPWGKSVLPN